MRFRFIQNALHEGQRTESPENLIDIINQVKNNMGSQGLNTTIVYYVHNEPPNLDSGETIDEAKGNLTNIEQAVISIDPSSASFWSTIGEWANTTLPSNVKNPLNFWNSTFPRLRVMRVYPIKYKNSTENYTLLDPDTGDGKKGLIEAFEIVQNESLKFSSPLWFQMQTTSEQMWLMVIQDSQADMK